jgi:hypothetical protein
LLRRRFIGRNPAIGAPTSYDGYASMFVAGITTGAFLGSSLHVLPKSRETVPAQPVDATLF